MSVKIITGYTGEKHILPGDDAKIYMGLLGGLKECVLPVGGQLEGKMPTNNQFVLSDGVFAIQGRMARITIPENIEIDTCPQRNKRIDLIIARYSVNGDKEQITIEALKGAEVSDSEVAELPQIESGDIDNGASIVDFPLYEIELNGGSVTFSASERFNILSIPDQDGNLDIRGEYRVKGKPLVKVAKGTQTFTKKTQGACTYSYINLDQSVPENAQVISFKITTGSVSGLSGTQITPINISGSKLTYTFYSPGGTTQNITLRGEVLYI